MKTHWNLGWLVVAALSFGCDDDGGTGATDCGDAGAATLVCIDVCVDTATDANNCGSCGTSCAAGQMCIAGACAAGGTEICDGMDNDGDGNTDEGAGGMPIARSCNNLCGMGTQTCQNGILGACSAPAPVAEVCDMRDNDCDGKTDETVATRFWADMDGDGFGDPAEARSRMACAKPMGFADNVNDCDDNNREINPMAMESCADEVDNNCNNEINEGCACAPIGAMEACGTDEGACAPGMRACSDMGWGECGGAGMVVATNETCDGVDQDCDGKVDEELADDPYEANNDCGSARPLMAVEEGAQVVINDAALYDVMDPDVDWYTIETDELFEVCVPGTRECGFTMVAKLTLPEGAMSADYSLCLYEAEACGEEVISGCTGEGTYDEPTRTHTVELSYNGRCGLENRRDYLVEVRGGMGINSCVPYILTFAFEYRDTECD